MDSLKLGQPDCFPTRTNISVPLKVDPPNYEQWTKAGAASNKSIENGPQKGQKPCIINN